MKRILLALLLFVPCVAWGAVSSGTFTIGPGQDYDTISDFEADIGSTLIGDVTGYINVNYNDTTAVTFEGTDTGAYYIRLIVSSTNRHKGKWDGARSSMTVSGSTCIRLKENNVIIDGMQIALNGTGSNQYGVHITSANCTVKSCIIKKEGTKPYIVLMGIFLNPGTGNAYAYNNIVYGFRQGTSNMDGILVSGQYSGSYSHAYNNTVYGCYRGINGVTRNKIIKNNLCNGNTTDYSGTFTTYETNISSDATSPNEALRNMDVTFVDEDNKDFHLTSTAINAIDTGTDLGTSYNVDIDGDARTGSWDIGADETVSEDVPYEAAHPQILIMDFQ